MKIAPVIAIGVNRPLCTFTIRVAAGLATNSARYGASQRQRKGVPIDQCGARGDFLVDEQVRCRAHAVQDALRHVIETGA